MEYDYTKEPGKELLKRNLDHSGEPLVSIITPFYNAGKDFEQTFNCVMNQTFPWFEWIIVDDGSTDQVSLSILEELSALDERIKVFHEQNSGPAAARNLGIKEAKTEIIIPLDGDDLIEPTYLEVLFTALHFEPNAAWAYTDSVGFGTQRYVWDKPFSAIRMKTENLLVCTAAIRRKALESVGCYEEHAKHFNEDWYTWLKLLDEGHYPVHVASKGFWYRRSDTGVLSIVKEDPEARKRNEQLIRQAASKIHAEVPAVEFPRATPGKYSAPHVSEWSRKVFKSHDKINVLMLLPWMVMGGADLFNLDVCARLDKARFEVGIITTQPGENSWQQRFAEHVTDIFNLPEFLDMENWAEFISYYIKSREVDVLFLSNSYYGYYLVPWLRKEFPDLAIIDYVHMEEWYWRAGGYARTSGVMGDILEKTYVCNERTRKVLINDFGRQPESVETLYIGVDQDKYDADKVVAGKAKAELGIAEDRPMILFPCRVHPQKRPFLMLEIAKEVKKKLPDIAFAVVGDGPQLEEMKSTAKQNGLSDTVYFAGRQSEMRPWYKDAALTLICSLKEGLALTAYESLAMSTPVVTSDVGGQAELINETVGRVVPLLQSEEGDLDKREFSQEEISLYVGAIIDLLKDKESYTKVCAACRKRIEEGFSTQIMIQKLERILDNLVEDPYALHKRRDIANALSLVNQYVNDSVDLYRRMEGKEAEAEEVWKSKEWFRNLYECELSKKQDGKVLEQSLLISDPTEAQKQLEEIYMMRSWKLIQRYRSFMDTTGTGKMLSKLRDLIIK